MRCSTRVCLPFLTIRSSAMVPSYCHQVQQHHEPSVGVVRRRGREMAYGGRIAVRAH